ncbi:MAG TPA: ligase-associated DNA damage response endonuclease PdeM [Sphingobium sp.]|nr:ligase-associated DNA damage response endonuclease PdeM [Sphingobium sp.]
MVPFLFHDAELHPLPCGALWWPAQGALLVADLHLEKASFYAATGQFLPPYDSHETALRLAERVRTTGARRLICLGDSFHDADGAALLPAHVAALLKDLAARVEWTWITGNHDGEAAFPFGRAEPELTLAGIALRHEALANDAAPEISGHYHPKIRLRHRGQSVARRCFLVGGTKLVMPAYGALTGGLDVRNPAIHKALRAPITALVPSGGRLLRFPVAQGRA